MGKRPRRERSGVENNGVGNTGVGKTGRKRPVGKDRGKVPVTAWGGAQSNTPFFQPYTEVQAADTRSILNLAAWCVN